MDDGTVLVAFELPEAVSATTVSVVGDFNGWTAQTHPLERVDGGFRTEIALPAGDRWRFRYLLDGGRWENDWAADDYVPNGLGDDDSVVDLTDPHGLPLLLQAETVPGRDGEPAAIATDPRIESESRTEAEHGPSSGGPRPGVLRRWWRRVAGGLRRAVRRAPAEPGPAEPDSAEPGPAEPVTELVGSF